MAKRGINKVILVGNLGQDPEVRFMPNGGAAANFTIATSESWKDKQTGEQKEKTEWHKLACFGKLAEICGEFLKKGSKIYVEGRLQTRKWQNQQGQDQYTTEVVFDDMQMLDSKPQGQQAPAQQGYQQQAPQQSNQQQNQSYNNQNPAPGFQQTGMAVGGNQSNNQFDDDVPF